MEKILAKIPSLLEKKAFSKEKIIEILENAKQRALNPKGNSEYIQGLSLEEASILLNLNPKEHAQCLDLLFEAALFVKEKIYGNRIVIFAPLYVSNHCMGSCLYCGFRAQNDKMQRKVLSDEEIVKEVECLQKEGHKRVLMLMGEHPLYTFDNFLKAISKVSEVKTSPHGEIRRINVEIPALTKEEFKKLKATGKIGTYTLFQETYHLPTYKKVHPFGPKSDYHYRLYTMDRALEENINDVGIGALFGLYDYRYEVLALLAHANYLDQKFRIGPHTISIPRLQSAVNTPFIKNSPYIVDDLNFKKLVAIIRLAVPYTGMILSTRESPKMRSELLQLGISQISAGSKTQPGGYHKKLKSAAQFSLGDKRSLEEVIQELIKSNFIPSFCTACYRLERTGEAFMKIAKKGDIHKFCHPNALMTFAEYLHDYANEKTQKMGFDLIEREILNISTDQRNRLKENLEVIKNGKRDLFY